MLKINTSDLNFLLAVPDMETQMNLSAKMIDRRTCTPKGNHSYGPFFLEYSLLAEYNLLQKQKLPGIYVIPSSETSLSKYFMDRIDLRCPCLPLRGPSINDASHFFEIFEPSLPLVTHFTK